MMTTPTISQGESLSFSSQTRLPRRGHGGDGTQIAVAPFKTGRKRNIKVRVNDEEHAAFTRLGKTEGGISALIRRCLLGQGITDARREALRELARLARNLNVIAVEARRFDPARTVEVVAHLVVIERELDGAIERCSKKRPT
jgi:hypothetical protein